MTTVTDFEVTDDMFFELQNNFEAQWSVWLPDHIVERSLIAANGDMDTAQELARIDWISE